VGTRPPSHPGGTLTERELEVLARLCRGQSSRQIGQELRISPRTVDAHVRHILRKLGARNRLEAVAIASRLDLPPSKGAL